MSTQKITGKITRILFEGSNKVGLIVMTPQKKEIKVLGPSMMEIEVGRSISAEATKTTDPKWGDQYNAEVIIEEVQADHKSLVAYLVYHADGIGQVTAQKVVEGFGDKTLSVIGNTPEKLKNIGLTDKQIASLQKALSGSIIIQNLWNVLKPYDVGPSVIQKIYETHKSRALDVIKKDPYSLCDIRGISFKTADKIALSNDISERSPLRMMAAARFFINDSLTQKGDTAVLESDLSKGIVELTSINDDELIASSISELIRLNEIKIRIINNNKCFSSPYYEMMEKSIAQKISSLVEVKSQDDSLKSIAIAKLREITPQDRELDPEQKLAVESAFDNNILVITGGPGCGKTTISQCIIGAAKTKKKKVLICSPTGKAAQRISEVTGMPADTIHGMLIPRSDPGSEKGWSFTHDEDNPIEADYIFMDEASMSDTYITYCFFKAISPNTKVILIGDADQIASVGAGDVLREIIRSKCVPFVKLKTVQRTAKGSDIPTIANMIITGNSRKISFDDAINVSFVDVESESETIAELKRAYSEAIKNNGVKEVQVLVSRVGTNLGVMAINPILRDLANPLKRMTKVMKTASVDFREGDRVIRNCPDSEQDIKNGEIGEIIRIDGDSCVIDFGRKRVTYKRNEMSTSVDLAYAITKHKSQGSEYKLVIQLFPSSHTYMLNRNLIYTAMTRGKSDVKFIGSKKTFHIGCSKLGSDRLTGLGMEIKKVCSPIYIEEPVENKENNSLKTKTKRKKVA